MDEIRCAFELREGDSRSPGRITGVLLRYGEQARRSPELFEAGSLRWAANGIVLNRQHDRKAPIMRVVPVVKDGAVMIDAPLPDTRAGRDTAEEVRSGLFRGLSIEFRAIKQTYEGRLRRIHEAILGGAGLVDSPYYAGSGVEVRDRGELRFPLLDL